MGRFFFAGKIFCASVKIHFLNFQYFLKILYLCAIKISHNETHHTWRRLWWTEAGPKAQ